MTLACKLFLCNVYVGVCSSPVCSSLFVLASFSSLNRSFSLMGRPVSSLGIMRPWNGHCRKAKNEGETPVVERYSLSLPFCLSRYLEAVLSLTQEPIIQSGPTEMADRTEAPWEGYISTSAFCQELLVFHLLLHWRMSPELMMRRQPAQSNTRKTPQSLYFNIIQYMSFNIKNSV